MLVDTGLEVQVWARGASFVPAVGDELASLEQAGVETNVISFSEHFDCIPDWYTPLLATTEKTIAQDSELVGSFTSATARGYEEAVREPGAAAAAGA